MSKEPNPGVSVEREVEVPADAETVWEKITDATMISDWMEGDVELDPRPGGRIEFRPVGGQDVWGTVEEIVDRERIQWSWRTDDGLPSLIEIELRPSDEMGTTLVTVRETLLPWRISGPDGFTEWPMASLGQALLAAA